MFSRRVFSRRRLLVAGSILAFTVGATMAAMPAQASQGSGAQWYFGPPGAPTYINAWSGGPWVNAYDAGALNNDFTLESAGGNNVKLVYTGNRNSPYYGDCLEDGNGGAQGDARAGLGPCGGWGYAFTLPTNDGCPQDHPFGFHNNHWNGWLGPTGSVNGDPYYLNNGGGSVCYDSANPY